MAGIETIGPYEWLGYGLGSLLKTMGQKGTASSVVNVHSLARGCGTELGSPHGQWFKKRVILEKSESQSEPHFELGD